MTHIEKLVNGLNVVSWLRGRSAKKAAQAVSDTRLYAAMHQASLFEIEQLIVDGANVNALDGPYFQTLLHHAAFDGRADVCKVFVSHDANPCVRDSFGVTAFLNACGQGHTPTAAVLFEAMASREPDAVFATARDGWDALGGAARGGHTSTCLFLLEHGFDPLNLVNGKAPADWAEAQGHAGAATALRAWTARNEALRAIADLGQDGGVMGARVN